MGPWVVGNLCAILGGLLISLVGSLAMPDKEFKWHMLNDRIPLVDAVEPPKDKAAETEPQLERQVKIAVAASGVLTLVLLVLWPIPMHAAAGVFSKGGFTSWVVLEILWALIGGIVIITLPVYETVKSFMLAKKQKDTIAVTACATLSNGSVLTIAVKPSDDKESVPTVPCKDVMPTSAPETTL